VGFSTDLRGTGYFDMQAEWVVLIAVSAVCFCWQLHALGRCLYRKRAGSGGYSIYVRIFPAVACSVPNAL
jgi:hypothetical protein